MAEAATHGESFGCLNRAQFQAAAAHSACEGADAYLLAQLSRRKTGFRAVPHRTPCCNRQPQIYRAGTSIDFCWLPPLPPPLQCAILRPWHLPTPQFIYCNCGSVC